MSRPSAHTLVWMTVLTATACSGEVPLQPPATAAMAAPSPLPEPEAAAAAPQQAAAAGQKLPAEQQALLAAWYEQVGGRRAQETFGELVVRAARLHLGKAYYDAPKKRQRETLRVELGTFQCVSFVESSIAVAGCLWRDTPDSACFMRSIEALRYRDGHMQDYGSRLHYFADWVEDNVGRGNLTELSPELGGTPETFLFDFMTTHPQLYPALADASMLQRIAADEARLSAAQRSVISEQAAWAAQKKLRTGDVVAIVSTKYPGLLVRHAGFIDVSPQGVPRLLHASSHHERVLLTKSGIAAYLSRMPDRRGMLAMRPVAPER